jgi:hypothetical protein
MKTAIVGYIVQDKSGIVAIFPDYADDYIENAINAERYAKKNLILETVEKTRDEDGTEFRIRLNNIAEKWKKNKKAKFMN